MVCSAREGLGEVPVGFAARGREFEGPADEAGGPVAILDNRPRKTSCASSCQSSCRKLLEIQCQGHAHDRTLKVFGALILAQSHFLRIPFKMVARAFKFQEMLIAQAPQFPSERYLEPC